MSSAATAAPAVFGLRYLEDEAAEIHDIVGCRITDPTNPPLYTQTGCDDQDVGGS